MNVLPSPGLADDADLAAEQAGDLAADRQAEAGAAVLAAGAAVGLLEGLEDDLLLVGGNADAGVADREGQRPTVARLSASLIGRSSRRSAVRTSSDTTPCSVNLKALESRFLITCCRRLTSVWIVGGRDGSSSMVKSSAFASATRRKVRST